MSTALKAKLLHRIYTGARTGITYRMQANCMWIFIIIVFTFVRLKRYALHCRPSCLGFFSMFVSGYFSHHGYNNPHAALHDSVGNTIHCKRPCIDSLALQTIMIAAPVVPIQWHSWMNQAYCQT